MMRVFWFRKNVLGSIGCTTLWNGAGWRLPQLEVRSYSYGQKNGKPIADSLKKMKNYLSERNFNGFQMELKSFSLDRKHEFLSEKDRMEVSSFVHSRTLHLLNDQDCANLLRSMGNLKYTVFRREDRVLIDEIIDKYLVEKRKSVRTFSLFLTALKSVKYNLKLLEQQNRNAVLDLFDEMSTRTDMTGRGYTEILNGIAGLGIGWKELNESTGRKLLSRLPEMQNKLEGISLYSVIFTYGKLSVNIKEVSSRPIEQAFHQIALNGLELMKHNLDEFLDRNREVISYSVSIIR
jgi:hypothetical protein